MVHPDDADGQEADQIGGVRRPEVDQIPNEVRAVRRDTEVENEERRRDREDAVAESLEPAGAHGAILAALRDIKARSLFVLPFRRGDGPS